MKASRSFLFMLLATLGVAVQFPPPASHRPDAYYDHEIFYSPQIGRPYGFPAPTWPSASANFDLLSSRPPARSFLLGPPAGNPYRRPAAPAVTLFTPNTVQQPAETAGQIENYRRALEEETREADNAENDVSRIGQFFDANGTFFNRGGPRSYVEVQVEGDKAYNFGYRV